MPIAARSLVVAATTVLIASVATWVATGAHRGWTKTKITEIRTEEVTGIEYPVTRDGFVMGVDLLGAVVLFSVSLAATGLWLGRKPSRNGGEHATAQNPVP